MGCGISGRYGMLQGHVLTCGTTAFCSSWKTEVWVVNRGGILPAFQTSLCWGRSEQCFRMSRSNAEISLKISILGTHTSPFSSAELKVNKTVFPGLCLSSLLLLVPFKMSWCGQRYLQDIKTGKMEKQMKTFGVSFKNYVKWMGKKKT